jgi:response regulator RpfG family c-di-GMP phosphodiesterase
MPSHNPVASESRDHISGEGVAPLLPARILLVDDDPHILSSLRRLFRSHGYEVELAHSGAEGLQQLARLSVDLVISDMRMPEMDGATFLARVAADWPHVVRILLTGYADLDSAITAINKGRIYAYFHKPWEEHEILLAVRNAIERKRLEEAHDRLQLLTSEQNQQLLQLNERLEQRVSERTAELSDANRRLVSSYQELEHSYFSAIPIFAALVELREGKRSGHGQRVGQIARELARMLNLPADDIRDIHAAGLLHDLGKIALPDSILLLPDSQLNEEQQAEMERHPLIGQSILIGLEPLQNTAKLIRHHHEAWDGSGYPDGLAGKEIPLGSRILALVNGYDSLHCGATYGYPMNALDSMDLVKEQAGKRYDPDLVKLLWAYLQRAHEVDNLVDEVHVLARSPVA